MAEGPVIDLEASSSSSLTKDLLARRINLGTVFETCKSIKNKLATPSLLQIFMNKRAISIFNILAFGITTCHASCDFQWFISKGDNGLVVKPDGQFDVFYKIKAQAKHTWLNAFEIKFNPSPSYEFPTKGWTIPLLNSRIALSADDEYVMTLPDSSKIKMKKVDGGGNLKGDRGWIGKVNGNIIECSSPCGSKFRFNNGMLNLIDGELGSLKIKKEKDSTRILLDKSDEFLFTKSGERKWTLILNQKKIAELLFDDNGSLEIQYENGKMAALIVQKKASTDSIMESALGEIQWRSQDAKIISHNDTQYVFKKIHNVDCCIKKNGQKEISLGNASLDGNTVIDIWLPNVVLVTKYLKIPNGKRVIQSEMLEDEKGQLIQLKNFSYNENGNLIFLKQRSSDGTSRTLKMTGNETICTNDVTHEVQWRIKVDEMNRPLFYQVGQNSHSISYNNDGAGIVDGLYTIPFEKISELAKNLNKLPYNNTTK